MQILGVSFFFLNNILYNYAIKRVKLNANNILKLYSYDLHFIIGFFIDCLNPYHFYCDQSGQFCYYSRWMAVMGMGWLGMGRMGWMGTRLRLWKINGDSRK
jgi:hypothetical protein